MMDEEKTVLICVVTRGSLPGFLLNDHELTALVNAGHQIAILCPSDSQQLADMWQSTLDGVYTIMFGNDDGAVIHAFNGLLSESFNWKTQDLVLIDNVDCAITPTVIEEMSTCMHLFDRRAIGNPRMNRNGWVHLDEKDAAFAQGNLPSVTRLPYPSSACVYLKARQLALFGPFDESFSTLEGALRDFSLKINTYGFDSVMLNHVFLPCADGTTTHVGNLELDSDQQALEARYEYLADAVTMFDHVGIDPLDRFMKLICNRGHAKPKILLDFSNMQPSYSGTSEYQIGLARCLHQYHRDQYDLHVYANKDGATFHGLERYCDNIIFNEAELDVYDLGFYSSQPNEMSQQIVANRHCARMVYTMLDTILLRCNYIDTLTPTSTVEAVRCGLENCDGIITISDYSKRDTLDYYEGDAEILHKPIGRMYVASGFGATNPEADADYLQSVPFSDYILIAGNHFNHKALPEAVEALKDTNHNYIVVGYGLNDYLAPNVFGYANGYMCDEMLEALYRNCSAFVFPSLYEGFGLPIVNALKCGKMVVVNRNQLNLEIKEHLGDFADNLLFFDAFDELPLLVDQAIAREPAKGIYCDSWETFTEEFCAFIDELIARPLDLAALRKRHYCYTVHEQEARKMDLLMQGEIERVQERMQARAQAQARIHDQVREQRQAQAATDAPTESDPKSVLSQRYRVGSRLAHTIRRKIGRS